ncbi:TPA: hypothetical protein EYM26_06715, partial [Candidatus Poribacteria bacterium]|nr:hypothetical protein [Candidatus Poribacteria bacterium]
MVKKSVISLLVMMIVFIGCGEDEPEKIKPKEIEVDLHLGMVLIPEGTVTTIEVETVNVDAFYMDKYEVTVG